MGNANRSNQGLKECDGPLDLSRWMQNLPEKLHDTQLNCLAIPGLCSWSVGFCGSLRLLELPYRLTLFNCQSDIFTLRSHDSFTFFLDRSSCVAPDEPEWMRRAAKYLGPCAKRIIYNWSSVQSLDVAEQLASGIRYFDIRLATKNANRCCVFCCNPECGKEHTHADLFCVHGLYGQRIDECLESVAEYLKEHRKEIVFLDFNNFYEVNCETHKCFIGKIEKIFGSKLCPVQENIRGVTLKFMWEKGYQVIVFYRADSKHTCSLYFPVKDYKFLWPGRCVESPWINTDKVDQLIGELETNYKNGRSEEKFYVTQGVLTPDKSFIMTHPRSTLKETLAQTAVEPFLRWVQGKAIGHDGLNICIIDCVELAGFTKAIAGMNNCQCKNYHHRDPTAE